MVNVFAEIRHRFKGRHCRILGLRWNEIVRLQRRHNITAFWTKASEEHFGGGTIRLHKPHFSSDATMTTKGKEMIYMDH
jgi:hypothetical protein